MIVFREDADGIHLLLIQRQKQGDWSFPKGHVEQGEAVLEAGLRELDEETGVRPIVVGRLVDFVYTDGRSQPSRISFFLGHSDGSKVGNSSVGERSHWVRLSQVEKKLSYQNLKDYFHLFVMPVFHCHISRNASIDVIFSNSEPYKNGAKLLTRTVKRLIQHARTVELNSLSMPEHVKNTTDGISYFLSNHPSVRTATFWLQEEGGRYVLNNPFLARSHTKSTVQAILRHSGIPVPPSMPISMDRTRSNKKGRNMFMIKSEIHGVRDGTALQRSSKTAPWTVYLEKSINNNFIEKKYGYVAGKVLSDDDRCVTAGILRAHQRIQECLGLEVFSSDVFHDLENDTFQIVDLNPAPAFFNNQNARGAFASYVGRLMQFLQQYTNITQSRA